MKYFYLTDSGKVRDHNEDSVVITKNEEGDYLMAIADGMGGHRAGEVASSLVLTHLGKKFAETSTIGTKIDGINWIRENIAEINKEIIDYTKENPESTGMDPASYEAGCERGVFFSGIPFGYPRL